MSSQIRDFLSNILISLSMIFAHPLVRLITCSNPVVSYTLCRSMQPRTLIWSSLLTSHWMKVASPGPEALTSLSRARPASSGWAKKTPAYQLITYVILNMTQKIDILIQLKISIILPICYHLVYKINIIIIISADLWMWPFRVILPITKLRK